MKTTSAKSASNAEPRPETNLPRHLIVAYRVEASGIFVSVELLTKSSDLIEEQNAQRTSLPPDGRSFDYLSPRDARKLARSLNAAARNAAVVVRVMRRMD